MKRCAGLHRQCLPSFSFAAWLLCGLLGTIAASEALANPWIPIVNPASPGTGQFLPGPKEVPGKDYSDIRDVNVLPANDPEQNVAWDGSGGVRDSFDYSGSRAAFPDVAQDRQVDAIANQGDSLFKDLRANKAALLFSVQTDPTVMYERATGLFNPGPSFGVWATATDIDAMNPPIDTDGLEVWGLDQEDDSDRYSLADDPFVSFPNGSRKVAIWEYLAGVSSPHTFTSDLAASMDMQFGGPGDGPIFGQLVELMDVDAIMTYGAQVTYSIQPLVVPGTPIAFDGGEIFEYDGPGIPTRFLNHAGHLWDTAFDVRGTFGVNHENIDALEAVQRFVPEPSSVALLMLGMLAGSRLVMRRR